MRHWLLPLCLVAGGCQCGPPASGFDGSVPDSGSPSDAGGTDAGLDASVPFDGGWKDCFESLLHGDAGDPCSYQEYCAFNDLCCVGGARCADNKLFTGGPAGTCQTSLIITNCTQVAAAASITGTTPVGAIATDYAWGSYSRGFAVDLVVVFGNSANMVTCAPAPRIGVYLSPRNGQTWSYLGVHTPLLEATGPNGRAVTRARVEITAESDAGELSGTLSATEPGWNLQGTFKAPECRDLDRSGP